MMILAVVTVAVSLATAVAGHGRAKATPGRQWRSTRWALLLFGAFCALSFAQDLMGKQVSSFSFLVDGFALVMVLVCWWQLGSPGHFSDAQAAANYASDRRYCGQCEYDLTGNRSGICPECGWRIPQQVSVAVDREPLTMGWRPWRIEHLHNWRKTLWETVLFAVMCAGAAVLVTFLGNPLGGIVLGLLGLVFLVHVGRVIACGRRDGRR
jgi:hypothetical protein